jgi:dTDP-4-amino-4,6-dideoxygalactose transaminase
MDVLEREYLGMGTEVAGFEQALTEYFSRPAVCVVNGTAALHLALQAAGLGPGDEVLVPSLTYVASFQAVSATGARPVACDVLAETLTLDCRDAEKRLTPRTRAVMPVHYSGDVGALDEVYGFADEHRLRVVEDAAHAFGSTCKGRRVGAYGDIACFSFDGIKNITSGEGGCIVTTDELILGRVRDARLLGVERDTEQRYRGNRSWEFAVSAQGWRYHMSNIMAAIGIEQFKRLPQLIARRRQLACLYDSLLMGHPRIRPFRRDYNEVAPHIYVVRLTGLADRAALREELLSFGIETGVHYQPNHDLHYYNYGPILPLPVTEQVYPELLSLPLHPDLSDEDVVFICQTLRELIVRAR